MRLYFSALICFLVIAQAQNNGRFEQAKRQALDALKNGRFDRAAGLLEEIWEQDQKDPRVAQDLATAYLNGEDRRRTPEVAQKAASIMTKVTELGADPEFLVLLSQERLAWVQGRQFNEFCTGRLTLAKGKVIYTPEECTKKPMVSFALTRGDVKEVTANSSSSRGEFRIVTREKATYVLCPRSQVKEDTPLMVSILNDRLNKE